MTGDRNDWRGDLAELFTERRRARGIAYASRRLLADVLSVALPRPRLGTALQDVRHALRLFRKHTGIVTIAVIGLGLAIAMCTTVFSILNATVLRPYGMDDPSTVVRVQRVFQRGSSTSWPYSAFVSLQRGSTLTRVEASLDETVRVDPASADGASQPERITFVSGGYLAMLGGRAVAGRTLDASDDRPGAAPVVVISHAYWMHRVNSDPSVIGRAIRLGGGIATVAGVLDPEFTGPFDNPPSFWAPFSVHGALYAGTAIGPSSQIQVDLVGRIAAGAAPARTAAQSQLSGVAAGLPPAGFGDSGADAEKTTGVQFDSAASRISGPDAVGVYAVIVAIFIVLGLVLALACANVANLLLAGASSRAREFGVRVAMGASRRRLFRQLMSESLVMGAAAGVLGFLLSMWITPTLARMFDEPSSYGVRPDLRVMLFAIGVSLVASVGAGLAPARYGARNDVTGLLKSQGLPSGSSPKASRLRRGFIAFQAAASMLLLVAAALFLRAALHITRADLGFDANRLATVRLGFPKSSADGDAEGAAVAAYWRAAVARVSALPAVEDASIALNPPFGGDVEITNLTHNGSRYMIFGNYTDARYFEAAGFRLVRGRGYTADEVAGRAPVAVVTESLVRDFLAGREPIGASLDAITPGHAKGVTIIGVVKDAITWHPRSSGNGTIYRPIAPKQLGAAKLVVRSKEPGRVIRDVESALIAVDPRVRLATSIMRDDVAASLNDAKLLAGLSVAVASLSLLLSVLGIFGVTSFVVGQRAQEMSVRMAIGASAGDVVRLLIQQNMQPVVGGLAMGLAVALLGSRALTAALSGISPYDPLAIVPAVVLLAGTALAAVAIPALRAARTDPASVLRQ